MSVTKSIIGNLDIQKPTVVWGAGISGLLIAYYLKKSGIKVSIKEITSDIGGKIQTEEWNDQVIEKGANALFLNYEVYDLLIELGLERKILIPPSKLKRYIFKAGSLKSVIGQVPFFNILKNLWKKTPKYNEFLSVEDFFGPWLGLKAVKNLLNPALGGIYSTTSDQILVNTLFDFTEETYPHNYFSFIQWLKTKRAKVKKPPLKGSVGLLGGMKTLVMALKNNLGNCIQVAVDDIPNFKENNNIFCTNAKDASILLKSFKSEVATLLNQIEYGELNTCTVFTKNKIRILEKSFGIVFVRNELKQSGNNISLNYPLGILANSEIFPDNYSQFHSYTIIDNNAQLMLSERKDICSIFKKIDPSFSDDQISYFQNKNWKLGLPIYNAKRYQSIKKIKEFFNDTKGVVIFGNYVAGISIREMCSLSKEFVKAQLEKTESKCIDPHVDVSGIIYGPVKSRRHGKSLGVNVGLANKKICTWSCLYCQCGFGERRQFNENDGLFSKNQILDEIKNVVSKHKDLDALTFAGNTEPGTHPEIEQIVKEILKLRNELKQNWKLIILSNGSELDRAEVVEAFDLADETWLKLDTGVEDQYQRLNRPLPKLGNLQQHLIRLKKVKKLRIQTLLWNNLKDKNLSNYNKENLNSLLKLYVELNPIMIHITTISRDPALSTLEPVNFEDNIFKDFLNEAEKLGIKNKIKILI